MIFVLLWIGLVYGVTFWHMRAYGLKSRRKLYARPSQYGLWAALVTGLPSLALAAIGTPWIILVGVNALLIMMLRQRLHPKFRAHRAVESIWIRIFEVIAGGMALVSLLIFCQLAFESYFFFQMVPMDDFLWGTTWMPQQFNLDPAKAFGIVPLLCGTLLITVIALLFAAPLSLLVATYISFYAGPVARFWIKPMLEILAGIPSIVYGFFALNMVGPLFYQLGEKLHFTISGESALVVGLVLGIMLLPYLITLIDDSLRALPQNLLLNAYALGATKSEALKTVMIPAAQPGIATAWLLAFSRAIGETMLVVMAAGLTAHLSLNPLESVTTLTVQIVSLLTGDQSFDSPQTLSAYALGCLLFILTLIVNGFAFHWSKKRYFDGH